jgi:hypothetical protein
VLADAEALTSSAGRAAPVLGSPADPAAASSAEELRPAAKQRVGLCGH